MSIESIYAQKCTEKSDINEHLPTLRKYADCCEHVTEFGVRHVVSTWALIAGRPHYVVSYDKTSPGHDVLCHVAQVAAEAGVLFSFFEEDVRYSVIKPTDLLFIDTYHTYSQLTRELCVHAPTVNKWIILHDTETFGEHGEAESEKGLRYAMEEFMACTPDWFIREHFKNNNGLTVLERVICR